MNFLLHAFRILFLWQVLLGSAHAGFAIFQAGQVTIAPSLSCSYTPVSSGTQSAPYVGATPSASGGTPSYTFSETGSLPSGLTINSSTGIISGTPSVSGSFPSIQVKVTDNVSSVANCGSVFTLTISTTNTCPQGTSVADGCSGSQAIGHGTIVNANLANPKQVVALNIVAGTGYTNGGPYTWTSSGGGCTTNATGTINVTGGAIGHNKSTYTITNNGAGCTSRPMIAIPGAAGAGTGGSITPSVYQLTPHNCASVPACNAIWGANYNSAGIDYPVGYDTTLTLSDPTAGGLPAGCAFAGSTVTCSTGSPVLNGWNFTTHSTHLVVSGGTPTITNNKFNCISTQLDELHVSGGSPIIRFNWFDGGASAGVACTSGGQNAAIGITSTSGTVTMQYNYCFNQDSKCVEVNNGGTSGAPLVIVEQFNYWNDFGICGGGCSHGEAEYYFTGASTPAKVTTWTLGFNTGVLDFDMLGTSNATSTFSLEADGGTLNNPLAQGNFELSMGNQLYTGSNNNNGQVSSGPMFCGAQEGGAYSGTPTQNGNILDYSGGFFPYNAGGSPGCAAAFATTDLNAGTGNICNVSTCD